MSKRRTMGRLAIGIVLAIVMLAAASPGNAVTTVIRTEESFVQPPGECFTEPILFTGFAQIVFGLQVNENSLHDHGNAIQQYRGIGLVTGDRYVNKSTQPAVTFVAADSAPFVGHLTAGVRIVHTGPTGDEQAIDDYAARLTSYFVTNANGEVVVDRIEFEVECQ